MFWIAMEIIILVVLLVLLFKVTRAKKTGTGTRSRVDPLEECVGILFDHREPRTRITSTQSEIPNSRSRKTGRRSRAEHVASTGQASGSYTVKELAPRICYICGKRNPGPDHRHF